MTEGFEKLRIWQEAHRLMLEVYKISSSFPKEELFGLTSQIRSAALSVPSNIAEAVGRFHYAESVKFMFNARGSAFEVRSQLRAAYDLGYIKEEMFDQIDKDYEQLVKGINSYVNYLREKKAQLTNESIS